MRKIALNTSIILLTMLAACTPHESNDTSMSSPETSSECPILKVSSFTASLKNDGEPTLNVSGIITVSSGGYSYNLTMGILDRMKPPTQRLNLTVTPPEGMATQAITDIEVSGGFPALSKSYKSIVILCGGEAIAEIADVAF